MAVFETEQNQVLIAAGMTSPSLRDAAVTGAAGQTMIWVAEMSVQRGAKSFRINEDKGGKHVLGYLNKTCLKTYRRDCRATLLDLDSVWD